MCLGEKPTFVLINKKGMANGSSGAIRRGIDTDIYFDGSRGKAWLIRILIIFQPMFFILLSAALSLPNSALLSGLTLGLLATVCCFVFVFKAGRFALLGMKIAFFCEQLLLLMGIFITAGICIKDPGIGQKDAGLVFAAGTLPFAIIAIMYQERMIQKLTSVTYDNVPGMRPVPSEDLGDGATQSVQL